jgi:hypothetical protein
MAMKYLLPCDCGKSIGIELSQAGQTVACSCGKKLDVPAMRAIRMLEPDEQIEAAPTKREWSAAHGAVFAVGSLLLVFGLGIGIVSHLRYSYLSAHIPPPPTPETTSAWVAEVDRWTAAESWEFWIAERDRETPRVSMHAIIMRDIQGVHQRAMVAYGIAAAGLLLAVGSTLLGARRK